MECRLLSDVGENELRFIRVFFISVCLWFAFRDKAHENANRTHTDMKNTRIKTINGLKRSVNTSPFTSVAGKARLKLSAALRCI